VYMVMVTRFTRGIAFRCAQCNGMPLPLWLK
jgi:hypothetical protein